MIVWLLACTGPQAEDDPTPEPTPPVLRVREPARFGVDDLICEAVGDDRDVTYTWSSGERVQVGAVLPVELASRRRTWTCAAEACGDGGCVSAELAVTPEALGQNVLLVLLDDIGVDQIASYGLHPTPASTPTLDALASEGVQFSHAWATPICSPTRAAIVTGKLPHRTGIGDLVEASSPDLSPSHLGLPLALQRSEDFDYTSVHLGKWHLSTGNPFHPSYFGFDHFAGSMSNLQVSVGAPPGGRTRGYYFWEKNVDGTLSWVDRYATTDTVDDAVAQLQSLSEPWFLWVALNAAHDPWHRPPEALLTDPLPDPASNLMEFKAMIQAADRELGRLLDALPADQRDHTTVFVLADNGTYEPMVTPPAVPEHAKGTTYEWGVRVPFWASGPLVGSPGAVSDGLVHVVDLYATAAVLAGVPLDDLDQDGISLLPYLVDPGRPSLRDTVVTESFSPNVAPRRGHTRVIRDERFKLQVLDGQDHIERLWEIPGDELDDAPELQAAGTLSFEHLEALERLRGRLDAEVPVLELIDGGP